MDALEARDIPTVQLDHRRRPLIQMGHGIHQRRLRTTTSSLEPYLAVDTVIDKALTLRMLDAAGIPVPRSILVSGSDEAVEAAMRIGYPVVVKPRNGMQGAGVASGRGSPEQVRRAYEVARRHDVDGAVLIEEDVPGLSYRVLVIDGKAVGVYERYPAFVVGDGEHDVRGLVDIANSTLRRSGRPDDLATPIELDATAEECLEALGLSATEVPKVGQPVRLSWLPGQVSGGWLNDRTDDAHPDTLFLAELAARVMDLDVAGIDLISSDIAQSPSQRRVAVLEVNSSPSLRGHLYPSSGTPRDLFKDYVDRLFPNGSDGRVPIIGVQSRDGSRSYMDVIGTLLTAAGRRVGSVSADSLTINDRWLRHEDLRGQHATSLVLRNPLVDTAIVEATIDGVTGSGGRYDQPDVVVIHTRVPGTQRGVGALVDSVVADGTIVAAAGMTDRFVDQTRARRLIAVSDTGSSATIADGRELRLSGWSVAVAYEPGDEEASIAIRSGTGTERIVLASPVMDHMRRSDDGRSGILLGVGVLLAIGHGPDAIRSALESAVRRSDGSAGSGP